MEYRGQKSGQGDIYLNLLTKGWYKEVLDLNNKEQDRLERLIRYDSDTFKVTAAASKGNSRLTLVAYLKREKNSENGTWSCRTLQLERL